MKGLTVRSRHRAAAPIIATLLLVAIAVVGGILIFVFTQGFFADEQVVGQTVDNIRIVGYDARDGTGIEGYTSGDTIVCTGATASNTLTSGDCLTVFIENLGDKPVAIQSVRIFGNTHSLGSAVGIEELFEIYFMPAAFANGATTSDCASTAGDFNLMTGTDAVEDNILDPNETGTLCIKYGGTTPIKMGKTIPIQIETANGQSSKINVFNGALRGQASAGCAESLVLSLNYGAVVGNAYTLTISWTNFCDPNYRVTISLVGDITVTSNTSVDFAATCVVNHGATARVYSNDGTTSDEVISDPGDCPA